MTFESPKCALNTVNSQQSLVNIPCLYDSEVTLPCSIVVYILYIYWVIDPICKHVWNHFPL